MSGETNLAILLASMQPVLDSKNYVFCSIEDGDRFDLLQEAIGFFQEAEGLTLILTRDRADADQLLYSGVFRRITLSIHSSLEAIGFLAAITRTLAKHGISVNPVSAYYHDHLFVAADRAQEAMTLLRSLSDQARDG